MKRETLAAIACVAGVASAGEPTTVTISVPWASATAEQVEESISLPVMKLLKTLPGIEQVRVSAIQGNANIEVTFVGVPKCEQIVETVQVARSTLPHGSGVPAITQGGQCKQ